MTADLPTVRAAIADALAGEAQSWLNKRYADLNVKFREDWSREADAILAKLSDPAVMDALARWLVGQEDGPFELEFPGSSLPVYRLRTRSEQ